MDIPSSLTEPTLSPLTLGCWSLIVDSNWAAQKEINSLAALESSLEGGVQSFNTASMYGDGASEKLLIRAFKGRSDPVTFTTKVGGGIQPA